MNRALNLFLTIPVAVLMACSGTNSNMTANASVSFKTWGNCDMCKETIEGSLKTEGIQTADWNKDTKLMSVRFDSTKLTRDEIEKRVAAVGYDTEHYHGDDKAYGELPGCCQYERKE